MTRLPTLSTHWHHGGCTHPLLQGTKLRGTSEHAYNYETTLSWEPLSLCLFTDNYCRNISDYRQKNMWSKACALLWVGVPSSLFHAGPHPTHYALLISQCPCYVLKTQCSCYVFVSQCSCYVFIWQCSCYVFFSQCSCYVFISQCSYYVLICQCSCYVFIPQCSCYVLISLCSCHVFISQCFGYVFISQCSC